MLSETFLFPKLLILESIDGSWSEIAMIVWILLRMQPELMCMDGGREPCTFALHSVVIAIVAFVGR